MSMISNLNNSGFSPVFNNLNSATQAQNANNAQNAANAQNTNKSEALNEREARVASIKAAVENGSYQVDFKGVAEKMARNLLG